MILKIKDFVSSWGLMHWVIVIVVFSLCTHRVYTRQVVRIQQASTENVTYLEKDIQEFNTMAERLGQMEELPPVRAQWAYVVAIAEEFGVTLKRENTSGNGLYRGPLSSWGGDVSGQTGAVLVAIGSFQQTVPTYLHGLTIQGNSATVKFSVLGGK